MLTIKEYSEHKNVNELTVKYHINKGNIPYIKEGNKILIDKDTYCPTKC